jgi:hypothetical protein
VSLRQGRPAIRVSTHNFSTFAGTLNFLTNKKLAGEGAHFPWTQKKVSINSEMLSQRSQWWPIHSQIDNFYLYSDAFTGGSNNSGGFGAILSQPENKGHLQVVA